MGLGVGRARLKKPAARGMPRPPARRQLRQLERSRQGEMVLPEVWAGSTGHLRMKSTRPEMKIEIGSSISVGRNFRTRTLLAWRIFLIESFLSTI